MILSLRPQFALGPFSFQNCCYARSSRSGPRHGFALGQNALEALAGNPPRLVRAKAIAPTALLAPIDNRLPADAENPGDLGRGIVVELDHDALHECGRTPRI